MKNPFHLVKDAGIDQEDGEILGAFTWDMPGQLTFHGSQPKWEMFTARGNMHRSGSKSNGPSAPGGSRSPRGRRP